MIGAMISTEISARIAEPAQDGDHAGGAFQARGEAFVGRLGLALNLLQQLRRNPAARRLAFRHLLGRFRVQHVHAAEQRGLEIALIQIALELAKFSRVVSELRNSAIGAGGNFLLELEILICAIRFCVLEWRDRDRNPEWQSALRAFR